MRIIFLTLPKSSYVYSAVSFTSFGKVIDKIFPPQSKEYSEETAAIIDEETKKIVDTGYNRAKQILSDNVDKLHKVAGILLEKEKIEADEFEAIFGENA